MAEVLAAGTNIDTLRLDGEYVVTDPASTPDALAAAGYFLRVDNRRSSVNGRRYTQQIAYRVSDGAEFYRAHFAPGWTAWAARAGGISDGGDIAAALDTYLGGSAWREPTDLSIAARDGVSITVGSSTGDDVVLPAATNTEAGLMSADDKAALDAAVGGGTSRLLATYPAAAAVSGHRIVSVDADGRVRHANPTDIADSDCVTGLSLNAAIEDEDVEVVLLGPVSHSWTLTPGKAYYLIAGGQIADAPGSGLAFTLQIGCALTTSVLLVHLEPPIISA